MARALRVEYPDAYYHVINRGNYREKIYLNDRDKEKFIEYLEKAAFEFLLDPFNDLISCRRRCYI
jgi:REP element-mobilizing transposase RayT